MDISVFDNGGKTLDRYTLVIDKKMVYTMFVDTPTHHAYTRYLCETVDLNTEEAGRLIDIRDLPEEIVKAIEINRNVWFSKETT